ncbi:MAG: SDR family NAD(P)-dependent oxidoreductase [Planctomycetota bacterium]
MSGRRALVTGASSGIGVAVTRLLAREGYRVALLARRRDRLDAIARELPVHGDGPHVVLPCDLTDFAAIERSLGALEESFGGLDLLVNNAGIGYRARVSDLDPDVLRTVFDTNVFALLLTCKAAHPLLVRGKDPVVVNVSSVVGRRGIPGQAGYAASKAAVCSIGEALRVEWADDRIAVTTLNPALTATGFFQNQVNPQSLPDPDLESASAATDVAREVLSLDRSPRPERSLRWKWRMLGILSILAPRFSDRMLVRRLGGDWSSPRR